MKMKDKSMCAVHLFFHLFIGTSILHMKLNTKVMIIECNLFFFLFSAFIDYHINIHMKYIIETYAFLAFL